jgi:hypothetical protein
VTDNASVSIGHASDAVANSIAIGNYSGFTGQGNNTVAIGNLAGSYNQGTGPGQFQNPFGSGVTGGGNQVDQTLTIIGTNLYIGGIFTTANGVSSTTIVQFDLV